MTPLEDVIAPILAIGGIIVGIIVRWLTSWPFWLCAVFGFIGFFMCAVAMFWLVSKSEEAAYARCAHLKRRRFALHLMNKQKVIFLALVYDLRRSCVPNTHCVKELHKSCHIP